MTSDYPSWLPPGALTDGALLRELERGAQAWSRTWFPSTSVSVRAATAAEPLRRGSARWRSPCQELVLAADRASMAQIARQMIGFRKRWTRLGAADTRFLSKLASACIEDFLDKAAGLLHVRSATGPATVDEDMETQERPFALRFEIGLGASSGRLEFGIRQEGAVQARKALISRAPGRVALGRRADAIRKQTVKVAARAGAGLVDLSELRSLAAGDVLVLDRELRMGLELTVNGRPLGEGLALHRDGAILSLAASEKIGARA